MRYKYKNDLDTNTNEFCPADPEFYPASLWCPQEDYFIWGQVNINQRYHCGLYFNEQSVSDGMIRLTAFEPCSNQHSYLDLIHRYHLKEAICYVTFPFSIDMYFYSGSF